MEALTKTRYATTPDGLSLAYQVVGEGPVDLLFIPGWYSHVEAHWEEPLVAHFLERLSSFSRLILFDRRGIGLSDPVPIAEVPSIEQWANDVIAVMDTAGSEQAAIFSTFNAGPVALVVAATFPERVSALVLFNTFARLSRAPDYPVGIPQRLLDERLDLRNSLWGTEADMERFNPSLAGNPRVREWLARYERLSASPGTARAMRPMLFTVDVRPALPVISAPTLVIHRAGAEEIRVGHGRYLSAHIPDAKFVELPGADSFFFAGDADALLDEVAEFLTGARRAPSPDRVLATVLFTDMVGSTERTSELGDQRWKEVLSHFERVARRQIERYRGREVFTKGDEFLVTFDGPARAVSCAVAIRQAARSLALDVRSGVHVGEVERRGDDVTGIAVSTGARVMALAGPGEILVSRTVVDLVAGSGLEFDDRGEHGLKGVPGTWRLFAVRD